MKTFPRIDFNSFLLAVAVLFSSSSVAAQAGDTHTQGAGQSQVGKSQPVQLEGQLEIVHQDFKDGHGRYVYLGVSATNASHSSYSGSAAATYVISTAPLSVSMTTNQSNYLPGQTVIVTVTLMYGTSPDAGASVTVTVTPPSGRTTTLSGTTDSNGVASLRYILSKRAPAGTYQVQYGTNGSLTGTAIEFTVQ